MGILLRLDSMTNILTKSLFGQGKKGKIAYILLFVIFCRVCNVAFSQTYQTNGDAVDFGNGLVRMTTSSPAIAGTWQTASAWSTTQQDLSQPFDMTFDMFYGCENGPNGGDGMTFTFQNKGLTALGGGGGFLGISGVTSALSIEFDTYDGTSAGGSNEIAADHIAIDVNGNVNNTDQFFLGSGGTMVTVQAISGSRDLEDCSTNSNDFYTIRVVWDPVGQTLKLYEEGVLTLTYTKDIINTIFGGNSMVYWGFTAATGSASNEQWIAPHGSLIPWECSTNSCCADFSITTTGPTTICSTPITIGVSGSYDQYSWSTGDNTSSTQITAPGSYTVTVMQNQSGHMCPSIDTVVISTTGPTAAITGGGTLCNDGTSTTPLSVTLTGTPPWTLTYAIDGVDQAPVSGIVTSPYTINGKSQHTYTLSSVIDGSGCNGTVSGIGTVNAYADLPIGNDNTFNPPGSTTLSVNNTGGTYEWYDSLTGGTLLYTGDTYTTPTLNATTTYYVVDVTLPAYVTKSVALSSASDPYAGGSSGPTAYGLPKADNWLDFTANKDFTFSRVTCAINVLSPWSSSKVSLTIKDLTAGTSYTKDSLVTTALASGVQNFYLNLNYSCTSGHSYEISYEGETTGGGLGGSIQAIMYWNLVTITPTPYHITKDSELDITQNSPQTQRYPGLFDWQISYGSPAATCGRTAVTAYENISLPVTLIDFTAKLESDKSVLLEWSTSSEKNNSSYMIQRSIDGIHFNDLYIEKGAGTSYSINSYSYVDVNVPLGIIYYRIKQTDIDGAYSYSNIKSVNNSGRAFSYTLTPNVCNGGSETFVHIRGANPKENLTLEVFDVLGRSFYKTVIISDNGGSSDTQLHLFEASVSPGTYVVVITRDNQESYKEKLVVIR